MGFNNNKTIDSILVSLDITLDVALEAEKLNVDLIIVHHPLIFSPLKQINVDSEVGKIIEILLKNNISLYVAHTNFDVSTFGMGTILSKMINLNNPSVLQFTDEHLGLGSIGTIKPMLLSEYAAKIKDIFHLDVVSLIGNPNDEIKTVAILGGSGSSLIHTAKEKGADLYISGDITYHHALEAKSIGLNVLDIGHHIEHDAFVTIKDVLVNQGINCNILVSTTNTNPYKKI